MFRRYLVLGGSGGCGIGRIGIRIARIRRGTGHTGLLGRSDQLRHHDFGDLLQLLIGRQALQNRHRTTADQCEKRRRSLHLEGLRNRRIGCDVDTGQLDLAVELVHGIAQFAGHVEQTVVGRHPQQ